MSEPSVRPASVWSLTKDKFSEDAVLAFCAAAMEEGRQEKWRACGPEHSETDRFAAMYYGKHLIDENPYRKRARENRLARTTDTMRAPLLDHRPDPELVARDPEEDLHAADIYNGTLNFVLENSDYKRAYIGFIDQLLVRATGIIKIYWDPTAFDGRGMVRFSAHDQRLLLVAPGTSDIQESPYVISVGMADVDSVLKKYPDRADEILAGLNSYSKQGASAGWWGTIVNFFYRTKHNAAQAAGGKTSIEPDYSRKIEVVEVYTRIPDDAALASTNLEDTKPESAPALASETSKAPSKIRLMVVIGGTIVARNDWMPYHHNRYPFITAQARYMPHRVWGLHDYETGLDALQEELDRFIGKQDLYNARSQFPWLFKLSTIPDEMFTQNPDAIVNCVSQEEINSAKYLTPPAAGQHVLGRRNDIHREIDDESGTGSIGQEAISKNIQPTTLSQVREAFEIPVRMKLKLMEGAFRELAYQAVALMVQYSEGGFIARVSGDSPYQPKTFKISKKDLKQIKDLDTLKFDVRFGTSTIASLSNVERFNQWISAIQAGALDPTKIPPLEGRAALLSAVDFPGWRSMIEKERKAREEAERVGKQKKAVEPPSTTPSMLPEAPASPSDLPPDVDPDEVAAIEAELLAGVGGEGAAPVSGAPV